MLKNHHKGARKKRPDQAELSRRERQAMDALYSLGRGTAAEIQARMPGSPSYSAVRACLRLLGEKGLVHHEYDGPRYVYVPSVPLEQAQRSAARHLLDTFFAGSAARAVAALLDVSGAQMSPKERKRIAELIEQANAEGR
jgi:predicted transcriptional regulator